MRDLTVTDREKILATAWSKLGVAENPPFSNKVEFSAWYGITGPWCAMYVSWCFYKALGYSPFPASSSKGFAYCPSGVNWFKDHKKWADKSVRPKRGWIVFFDFIGRPSHVGIVLDVLPDGRLHTIEGNTNGSGSRDGGSVMEHYRSTNQVVGYGIMDFIEDKPKWQFPVWPGYILQRGQKSQDVGVLKLLMISAGYRRFISTKGPDLYEFGAGTEAAVKKIQLDRNAMLKMQPNYDPKDLWLVTGKVGPKTWNFICWLVGNKQR